MKETITNDEMWDYIHRYYGYGCVDAPVYLIGQEEGGGNIDYRYDRFINAEKGTFINTPNPIDPRKKIRTLDGSVFHKQIRLLEQKNILAEKIAKKILKDKKVKVDKDLIAFYIPDDLFVNKQIDHTEIKGAKEELAELLTNKPTLTVTPDEIPTGYLTEWLYSGNIETEMTQSTFTPIVDNIISPLYAHLYNTKFEKKEFQAKYMARIKLDYPLFVTELYPLACVGIGNIRKPASIEAWEDINSFCNNNFISPLSKKTYSSIYNNKKSTDYDDKESEQYRDLAKLILNSKHEYYKDTAEERYKTLKALVEINKPKVVIMYGGIGDAHFNPYWNKIAGFDDADWKEYIYENFNFYIKDNGKTIFVKTPHPQSHGITHAFFAKVYSSIVDYSTKHNIPLSVSLS